MKLPVFKVRALIGSLLESTDDVGGWTHFELDLQVPDDVYSAMEREAQGVKAAAAERVMLGFIKTLVHAGCSVGSLDWEDDMATMTISGRTREQIEKALFHSDDLMIVDHEFKGSDAVECWVQVYPRTMEDPEFEKLHKDQILKWFEPYRQGLEDIGAMNIDFRPIGPAGGNPYIKGQIPQVLFDEAVKILAPIALGPPIIKK